ncbi:hypothetical protein MMC26_002028 [Xylographa opegraphella]|nr:hypothetical protein [Xylographa opegraphella]
MADTTSGPNEVPRSDKCFVPGIDIDWIEAVLKGTISLPNFQVGGEVGMIDDESAGEYGHRLQLCSSGLSTPVHQECDSEEQLRHVIYEADINNHCNCDIAPFFSYGTGLYVGEKHHDLVSTEHEYSKNAHVHTELGPMTRMDCFRRQVELFGDPGDVLPPTLVDSGISNAILVNNGFSIETAHTAELDHNINGTCLDNEDATLQQAEEDNNKDPESDPEDLALSIGDDQWEDVYYFMPLESDASHMELARPADADSASIPSAMEPPEEDHKSRTSETIDVATMHDRLGPDEANEAAGTIIETRNSIEPISAPVTDIARTFSEVSAGQDQETCGSSYYVDMSGSSSEEDGLTNMSVDNDSVCICVSDMVARVAKEARANFLASLAEVLRYLVKEDIDFSYQKETNPWIVQLFDKWLHKAFEHILIDLECLDEVTTKPTYGSGHRHINCRMSDLVEEHIENVGNSLLAEVKATILVKHFTSDMVNFERGTIAWPQHGTKHKSIVSVNQHCRLYGGLSGRISLFLLNLGLLVPIEPRAPCSY